MTLSRRLPWHQPPNALTQALQRLRAANRPLLDLTGSNPTRTGIAYDEAAILKALGDPRTLVYEPSPRGLAEAREAISRYCYAGAVPPGRILLTASTSEAYSFLFKLLCDPGDEVLVPRPSYPLFEHLASLEGVAVRQYPLRYHEGWWIDPEALRALIGPRTRAIVSVNPNNPTGSYLKRDELCIIEEHGIALVSDEVFSSYAFHADPNRVPVAATAARGAAFSLNGFSKLLGLPQMKLGWIAVNNAEAMDKLEFLADTYLSVSAPVQHAAAAWLACAGSFHAQMMARLRGNLDWLCRHADPLRVEGGWSAILRLPRTRGEEEWVLDLLERDGVLVQPGYFYDFETEAYAVVSLLTPPEQFREGIGRILERTHVEH